MPRSFLARQLSAPLFALLLFAAPVSAQTTYTWTGGDVDSNWFSPLNWSASGPGSPPPINDLNNTFVVLAGTNKTTNTLDYSFSANSLTFGATAGAFVVGTATNETLTLGVGGLTVAIGNTNNQTFNANLAVGAAQAWTNNGTGTLTLGGAVTGGSNLLTLGGMGNITFASGGSVSLGSGGLTNTNTGVVSLGGPVTLAAASTVANNAAAGTFTVGGAVNLNGFLLTVGGTGNSTYGGVISGDGGLTKTGTGTVTLSGTNTYTGVTNVNGGAVSVTNASGLGATGAGNNTVVSSGAALQVGGSISIAEPLTLNGTGVSNDGALRKTSGSNTTTVSGAVTVASNARINNDIAGGTLTISGAVGVGANTLTVGGAGPVTISGQITLSTTGTFVHDSPSTVTVSNGANGGASGTFLGSIQVTNGGVLSFQGQNALGNTNATGTFLLDNGTLWNTSTGNAGTFVTVNRNIVLGPGGGTLRWDDTGVTATTGPNIIIIQNTAPGTTIQGTQGGALNKAGGGIIAVAQPATYDGPTNVLAGALRVRISNNIFPTGTALSVSSGAVFDLNGLNQQVGSLTGAGDVNLSGGTFTVGNGASTTFTGRFTDAMYAGNGSIGGKVTKVGTGALTVGSNSFYSGATTISGGVLSVGSLNDGGVSGFTITTTQGSTTATVSSAAGLAVGMTVVNRNLALGSTITNIAGTTITLSAPANLAVTANAAAAGFPSSIGIAPSAAGNLVLSGGTLQYTGPAASTNRLFTLGTGATAGAIDASGSGPINFTNTGSVAFTGTTARTLTLTGTNTGANTLAPVIGDVSTGNATSLTKTGSGTWVLSGANTYTGATTLSGGTLVLGNAAAVQNSTVSVGVANGLQFAAGVTAPVIGNLTGSGGVALQDQVAAPVTLAVGGNNASPAAFSGILTGPGGLTKQGTGTLTLTGANTYTGATAVNAGTLAVGPGGSLAAGSAVTVGNGGVLAGVGTVNGTVGVNGGGAIRGDVTGGTGTMTVGSNVTLANNGVLRAEVSRSAANTASASRLAVTGPGVLNLAPNVGDKFVIDILSNVANPMVANETYTIILATVGSGTITVNGAPASGVIDPSAYVLFPGMTTANDVSLTSSGGNLVLTFTPVPEPATVLAAAAGVLGLSGFARRARGRRGASA